MPPDRPIVSIIVCTRNRAELLRENLKSLSVQSANSNNFEVIVVDNGSTDQTREVIQRFASQNDNIRRVLEPRVGLSHARNRGCKEAKSDWLVYLDDDTMAPKNYVDRVIHTTRHYDFDCFGGAGMPLFAFGKPKWAKHRYFSNENKLSEVGELPGKIFVDGFNCAFKKKRIEEYGGFSPSIGMKGDLIAYGEETQLQIKMRRDGKKIGFDPELVVANVVMPHKLKVIWFFKSEFSHGKDFWHIFDTAPTVGKTIRIVLSMIGTPIFYLPAFLVRLFQPDYYLQNLLIDLLCPSSGALGKVFGAVKETARYKHTKNEKPFP
jgi:glucosyl-dolichyl phosphate glucuronosyltransferase